MSPYAYLPILHLENALQNAHDGLNQAQAQIAALNEARAALTEQVEALQRAYNAQLQKVAEIEEHNARLADLQRKQGEQVRFVCWLDSSWWFISVSFFAVCSHTFFRTHISFYLFGNLQVHRAKSLLEQFKQEAQAATDALAREQQLRAEAENAAAQAQNAVR